MADPARTTAARASGAAGGREDGSTRGSDDEERRGLGRGGSLNLAGAVCQQACLFLTTAVIARAMGSAPLGVYVIVYAALTLGSLVGQLGLRSALTRFVAAYLATGEPGRVRGLLRLSAWAGTGATLLLSLLVALLADPLARIFGDPGLRAGFLVVAATMPAFTVRDLALAAVQGWRTQRAFSLVGWFYEPVVRLGITVLAAVFGWGLTGAFAALLVAAWTAALASVLALARRVRRLPSGATSLQARGIISYSIITWGTVLASTGLIWADSLILGWLSDPTAVGVYTVAARLVTLAVFVMAPINALFAPHFAHAHAAGDHHGLQRDYTTSTNLIMRLSLPAFVVLVVFPADLLGLFGDDFGRAASVTIVLAAGQLVNAATGPCGTLLNMSGHARVNLVNNVVVLVLNVALNVALIPRLGVLGAGVAWAVSLSLVNLVRLLQTHRLLGLHPFNAVTLHSLLAAGVGAAAGLVVRLAWGGGLVPVVVGLVAVILGYTATSVALGFSDDERAMLRGLRGLRGRSGRTVATRG